ncbi:hypothetical protein F5144DRAFT_632284 [Chaetomium tenue]|uniref:Uncharacterized protein n=1 Tax=Chaetomium tenue TaxID=1854479 RepID=A0ACB7P2H2_9PEZI|nr:hypothetical protein F5144DRAFT_632284 [Chaetomium globosum]
MAPSLSPLSPRHEPTRGSSEPLSGLVISVALSMLSISALSAFTTQRYLAVKTWKQLPFVQWLVFAIYTDSFMFVFATAVLQFGFGAGYSSAACETAILLCLICYVTTKVLIYLFLVEKAYIIRSSNKKPRLKSKLYIFNSFGMIGAYCLVVVPNFVLRFARVENGECIIGMQRPAMIPLIVFDLLVNVYLTIIFLKPLSSLYSYKNFDRAPGSRRLKTMATRTFIGCICTLASSIVNLSVLVGLNGEPGWVCLMCCNSDILFSAAVIHWVTSRDSTTSPHPSDDTVPSSGTPNLHNENAGGGGCGPGRQGDELSTIPHRAHRHMRLPDSDDDDNNSPATTKAKPTHRTHLSLSTEAEAIIVDDAAKMSGTPSSSGGDDDIHGDGDGDGNTSRRTTTSTTSTTTDSALHEREGAGNTPFSILTTEPSRRVDARRTSLHRPVSPSSASGHGSNNNNDNTPTTITPPHHLHPHRHHNHNPNHPHIPTPAPTATTPRNRAASEVRVDIDYGTTTTTTTTASATAADAMTPHPPPHPHFHPDGGAGTVQGLRMGNEVVIGCGAGSGSGVGAGVNARTRTGTGTGTGRQRGRGKGFGLGWR